MENCASTYDCQLSVRQVNPRQYMAEIPQVLCSELIYDLAPKFMKENELKHVTFSTADGALEAAPALMADAIVDLAVLVASRKSLTQRNGVLDITHEILERLESRLRAAGQLMVTANMRETSAEKVAERGLSQTSLLGLQGPTITLVFCKHDGRIAADYYAIVICVPKKLLYKSIQQLRAVRQFSFFSMP
ncbi:hypothetical protein RHMOL_Rhmol11G0174700 [Rhododendron molle]|uniref:Uncharacterized protein n=1 Tax=Rhododendron molle TaxID=49168 RepID=A0ACC0LUI9_RHOML|nr:hypothetical protein RHMOL_Rhmol11G0174700 [Rhododendron molle]